jgi:hypothetical protein
MAAAAKGRIDIVAAALDAQGCKRLFGEHGYVLVLHLEHLV